MRFKRERIMSAHESMEHAEHVEHASSENKKTAVRYRSEPETGEGSEQLSERAKHAEHERDLALARYHHYEIASAAFQIGIVLASATIITGMIVLAWGSGVLVLVG